MDVKFNITGECRADNIDLRCTEDEIKEQIVELFNDYCGIKAYIKVSNLTYIHTEGENGAD